MLPAPPSPPESVVVAITRPNVPLGPLVAALTVDAPMHIDCRGQPYPGTLRGGGAYRVVPGPAGDSVARLEPTSGRGSRITIRVIPRQGSRDAIDRGVDLLITDDPAAIGYAARRSDLISVPLPWHRTYAVVTPRAGSAAAGAGSPAADSLRAGLATDAVGITARAADLSRWWLDSVQCPSAPGPSLPPPRGSRIAFDSADATARALAERLASLANRPGAPLAPIAPELAAQRGRVSVAPLGASQLAAAIFQGTELAFVLPFPQPVSPCLPNGSILGRASWLMGGLGQVALPLVNIRPYAIARPDRIALFVDADGRYQLGNAVLTGAPRP